MNTTRRLAALLARSGVSIPDEVDAAAFELGGVDSLVALDFLLSVERDLGIQLDAAELLAAGAFDTLGSLADYVIKRSGGD